VARELGLPCNPERTGIVARNKYEMRCAFRDAGLYTPVFYQAGADFSLDDMPALEYPVIVKPTDRWSSKGVTRVDRPEELKAAVDYAVSESFNNKAIIEGFMDGPEYSAECICYKGQRHVLAFTKKQTTGCPHYIETGHIQPSDIPADRIDAVKNVILKGLEALDIQNGAAHAEFRLLENGQVGIVEIGARMGGGCIGTDLTPISTGMDYIRMVVDVACGRAPKFETVTEPSPVAVKFILTEEDLRTMEKVLREESEKVVRTEISNTDFSVKVVDGNMRHGYYIVKM